MIAWKPWEESIGQATRKPRPVTPKEMTKVIAIRPTTVPAVRWIPLSGASRQKSMPWSQARLAPPRILPSTMLDRGAGETRTDCRKPSRRSSMMEIVEKIAVKSRISTSVPGKKYSR